MAESGTHMVKTRLISTRLDLAIINYRVTLLIALDINGTAFVVTFMVALT